MGHWKGKLNDDEMTDAVPVLNGPGTRAVADIEAELERVAQLRSGLPTNVQQGQYASALEAHLSSVSTALQLELEQTLQAPGTTGTQANHCTRLFAVRISVLLLLTWFAVMAGSISCLALPLSIGRRLINALFHVVSVHDAHAYLVGFGILWTSELALKSASSAVYRHRFGPELVREAAGWLRLGLKLLSIATLWLGLIPLLIGLLFELTVWIPLRVPVWQNPVFSLFQDWALGLFYLKIGIRTLMAMPSLAPTWHRKFEQVRPVLCGFA